MKIRKNDNIIVIAGKDKGKKAKVLKVFPSLDRVLVEGVNVVKRHRKGSKGGKKGEIVEVTTPIHVSNVALLDPKSGKATRVKVKTVDGKKIRIASKSGAEIK